MTFQQPDDSALDLRPGAINPLEALSAPDAGVKLSGVTFRQRVRENLDKATQLQKGLTAALRAADALVQSATDLMAEIE